MNILVLGGSYFLGKHFVNIAKKEHDITVFNRGKRPLMLPQVKEMIGDRHNTDSLAQLGGQQYDAIVDFCAYEKGDIASVFQHLQTGCSQYIFISTCDVYEHGLGKILDENAGFEQRHFEGETGAYIAGKVALEEELIHCANQYGVAYTSIRPAFIYGPENYAPRESIYFHWIKQAGQILHPMDATGEFQMVYVKDVAKAILYALGYEDAYNQAFNLSPFPMVTYESFSQALSRSVSVPYEKVPVTLQMIFEKQIPLPFPLTREESNWYNGEKVLQLIGSYTQLSDGLRETANYEMGQ